MNRIRTLIVDDEPLARERLRALLEREPDIEVVGECADGPEAAAALREQKLDLVFLDVQMPGLDGFGVLESLGTDRRPAVIFVTAYDRYALKAFEVHALDYLLKPFDRKRFAKALDRARAQVRAGRAAGAQDQLRALLAEVQARPQPLDRLAIKSDEGIIFLKTDAIDWVESAGNYLKVHAGGKVHLLRETMSALESRLDPAKLVRIHRSFLVNIDRIEKLEPWFHGDYRVLLRDGKRLTLTRNYRPKLQKRLGNLF